MNVFFLKIVFFTNLQIFSPWEVSSAVGEGIHLVGKMTLATHTLILLTPPPHTHTHPHPPSHSSLTHTYPHPPSHSWLTHTPHTHTPHRPRPTTKPCLTLMDSFAGTMSSSLLCVKGLKAPPLVFSVNITHGFRMYPVAPLNSNLA